MRPVFFGGRAAVLKSEPFAAKYHTRSFLVSLEKGGCCISGVYLEASDFVRLQDIYIYRIHMNTTTTSFSMLGALFDTKQTQQSL